MFEYIFKIWIVLVGRVCFDLYWIYFVYICISGEMKRNCNWVKKKCEVELLNCLVFNNSIKFV